MAPVFPERLYLGPWIPDGRPRENPRCGAKGGASHLPTYVGHGLRHKRGLARRRSRRGGRRLSSDPFLGGVRQIQATHFRRRRRLARQKAHDRRVQRKLLAREGKRERNRVRQRLHLTSKLLVDTAKAFGSAIVLESLTLHASRGRSRRMNRRLSSWPRGEIHRQIEYKAALAGVPIIKVNPQWTSKTCPVCGARRRDRVGKDFVCLVCDWEMDRQINAGLNILKTALTSNEALARAVRFQPGALRHDAVIPLYDLLREGGGAREEPSGVESRPSSIA